MNKFERALVTEWRQIGLPTTGAAIVIAVSGGADSSALLAAVGELTRRKKLSLDLTAAHLDHGLRGGDAARDDRRFVAALAARFGARLLSDSQSISRTGNLEQNARRARYGFLARTAAAVGAGHVLTAHTVNDQAETFLMNLIRGAGRDGLAAMPISRLLDDGPPKIYLVRPLLRRARRADTESYCREMNIDYRRDPMNDDEAFTRVRVRKSVLPLLAAINPQIVETLAATAALFSRSETAAGGRQPLTLKIADLRMLADAELSAVLRLWLRERRGRGLRGITAKHIDAVVRLVRSEKSGRRAELPGGEAVIKTGGQLLFTDFMVEN